MPSALTLEKGAESASELDDIRRLASSSFHQPLRRECRIRGKYGRFEHEFRRAVTEEGLEAGSAPVDLDEQGLLELDGPVTQLISPVSEVP